MAVCSYTRANGESCRARALNGKDRCFFHDLERADQRTAARRAGGLATRGPVLPESTPDLRLQTAQDVLVLVADTINRVRTGELDPRVGNCVGYLSGIFLKAVEAGFTEERLRVLEKLVLPSRYETSFFDVEADAMGT